MKKSFAVIGLGRLGRNAAVTLCEMGNEVLAVDMDESMVRFIQDRVTHAVQADCTDERTLRQLGIQNYDAVIVSIGDDIRASVLITLLCKEMGAKEVIAKASDDMHKAILLKTGADRVIQPEKEAGSRLAKSLVQTNILNYLELSDEYSIHEMTIPSRWVGKTLMQLRIRNEYDTSVIAIRRGDQMMIMLDPNAPLETEDIMVMMGRKEGLDKIRQLGVRK